MLINLIHNVEDTTLDSPPVAEPVGLQEMKDYLRLEGDSPADEFDFDDDYLTDKIHEGRQWVESVTGQHVIPKTLTTVLSNQAGGGELPGPVRSITSFTDSSGNVILPADYEMLGTMFPSLTTQYHCRMTFVYEAGYVTAPKWVKNAIKAYVAFHYENRGDEQIDGPPKQALNIVRAHKRGLMWG